MSERQFPMNLLVFYKIILITGDLVSDFPTYCLPDFPIILAPLT